MLLSKLIIFLEDKVLDTTKQAQSALRSSAE
jgi:hypothetical protein